MLKPGDQHLTEDELDQLADVSCSGNAGTAPAVSSDTVVSSHLSNCHECRHRLQMRMAVNAKLTSLRANFSEPKGKSCPTDEELMNVAAKIADPEVSHDVLNHAAQCDHCGPQLREMMDEFADSRTPEEADAVATLESSTANWQKEMAVRLSGSARQQKSDRSFAWPPRWVVVACGVAVLAVAAIWVVLPRPEHRVEELLAVAYSERRTLEPRISGADFGPIRIERAAQASHMDSPPSLLEAEKEIASHLAKHPSDAFWLQSRARAELLEGNYSGAIEALRLALAEKVDSPSLLIDLATAYSQRADATGHSEDYGTAVDLLGQALQKSPRDPIALFNRALISRKAMLLAEAIQDWETYLEIDPKGKWAEEARTRLQEVEREQEKRKQGSVSPLLAPSAFAQLDLNNPETLAEVDEHFEAYQAAALFDWMLSAYPVSSSQPSDTLAARAAVRELAEISLTRHCDRWWADFLKGAASPYFPWGLQHLSLAIKANQSGLTEDAHKNAALAIHFFRIGGRNEAGIIRAHVEDLYAFNIEQNAARCADLRSSLHHASTMDSYGWLAIHFRIQSGNCAWLQEDLGEALAAYASAAAEAEARKFYVILLHARDHWSMAAGASGDYRTAWRLAQDGLAQFWNGNYEDVRGYNFYYSLYEVARLSGKPFLQLAVWKDAIPLTESSGDLAQVAVAHSLFADSALAAHDSEQAIEEFDRANQWFARSPQIESTRIAQLEVATRLAGVEVDFGDNQAGLSRLRAIETDIADSSDNYLKVLFYDKYGTALLKDGNLGESETALRSAVGLAERQLQSVRDDNARAQWKLHAADAYRDLVSLVFRKGDTQRALELWEAFQTASSDSSDSPQISAQLRSLANTTVMTYVLLPEELLVWVYDDRGVYARRVVVSAAQLSKTVASFRELCADPRSDLTLIREMAQALYRQLVGPIESYLSPGRSLTIELDEGLAGLPFEALSDGQGHYLGERSPILSSLGPLYGPENARAARVGRNTPALLVAVPAPQDVSGVSVPVLPDVSTEAEAIATRFNNTQILTAEHATVKETLELLPQYGVFHFAGHASPSTAAPGLLLFDGLLTSKFLEGRNFPKTQLVVLSACDTDGVGSLADAANNVVHSFLRAGVTRVVASRWNVDSASTRLFMDSFYQYLLSGASVEDSLFHAQKDLREQVPTAHPFFWSAFMVFGSDGATM